MLGDVVSTKCGANRTQSATGETVKIKAKTAVKFRLSKSAKDAVVPPKA